MSYDAQSDAAEVASVIAEYGNTITLAGGATIKSIVEENYDSIRREVGLERVEEARSRGGRVVLFYFTAAGAASIPAGTLLAYNGAQWTPEPGRTFAAGDTQVMTTLLCTSGGTT